MTDKDEAPHWRDPAAYAYIDDLRPDERRWEFLRRSRDYRVAFAAGHLLSPSIARVRFGIVGPGPDPATRGDGLDLSFRFASLGELARIGTSQPVKPLPAPGQTFADFRIDLTRSIREQVQAIQAEAEGLAAALSAEWAAQERASTARRRGAGPFAQLSAQVTSHDDEWERAEDGAPTLNPGKPREGQAPVRLLQVLDALDAGATRGEISEALFHGSPSNTSTAVKSARAAAKAAAKSWP